MQTESLSLDCYEGTHRTEGQAIRQPLNSGERVLRAFRSVAAIWGVAFVCIFIPILHFFLVPLFLLLGIVMGVLTYMQKSLIASGTVTCPNCKSEVQLQPNAESWPRQQRCTSCYLTLKIVPKSSDKL